MNGPPNHQRTIEILKESFRSLTKTDPTERETALLVGIAALIASAHALENRVEALEAQTKPLGWKS